MPPFPLFLRTSFGVWSELSIGTSSISLSFTFPLISFSPRLLLTELPPETLSPEEVSLLVGPVRAHDSRSLNTSWALFYRACLEQILKAAFWSNSFTFIACYLKDVFAHEASFTSASLGVSGSALRVLLQFPWVPQFLSKVIFTSSPFILGVCAILHIKGRQSR